MKVFWFDTVEGPKVPAIMVPPGMNLANSDHIYGGTGPNAHLGYYNNTARIVENKFMSPEYTQEFFDATDDELYEFMNVKAMGPLIMANNRKLTILTPGITFGEKMEITIAPNAQVVEGVHDQMGLINVSDDYLTSPYDEYKADDVVFVLRDSAGAFSWSMQFPMGHDVFPGYSKTRPTTDTGYITVLIRDEWGNVSSVGFALGSTKVLVHGSFENVGIHNGAIPNDAWKTMAGSFDELPKPIGGCFVDVSTRFSPRVATSGLGIYPVSKQELSDFTKDMWHTTFAEKFIETINGKPLDSLITTRWYYGIKADLNQSTTPCYLTMGNVIFDGTWGSNSVVTSNPVLSEFVKIDCGIVIVPRWHGNFLDYSPFTQLEIYIPFIGYVRLDASEFIDKSIRLIYSLNIVTGGCVAHVYVERPEGWRMVMEIPGSMGTEIPFNVNARETIESRMITGIAGAGMSGIGFAAMAAVPVAGAAVGASAMTAGVAGAAANNIQPMQLDSGNFNRSGGMDSETSSMACFRPYIRMTSPIAVAPSHYDEMVGRPDYRNGKLSTFTGYMKVGAIQSRESISNIPLEAMNEIEQILKGGVYSV